MTHFQWHYQGDVDLRQGGLFWRETGDDEMAWIVRVSPCSDAGGPDNLFRLAAGHVHIPGDPDRRGKALAALGLSPKDASRQDLVTAFAAWQAPDFDEERVIRIGPPDRFHSGRGDAPEPDTVLRDGTDLRKWVTREFLHREPVPEASGPRP